MDYKEFTAQELTGPNNRNVADEILNGLAKNYGGKITDAQKAELLAVWRQTIGTAPNYVINADKLRDFYNLKARFMGTVSDSVINEALAAAGTNPQTAAQTTYTASPEAQQAAAQAVNNQTIKETFFTKYKTPLLIGAIIFLAAAVFIYFKIRK